MASKALQWYSCVTIRPMLQGYAAPKLSTPSAARQGGRVLTPGWDFPTRDAHPYLFTVVPVIPGYLGLIGDSRSFPESPRSLEPASENTIFSDEPSRSMVHHCAATGKPGKFSRHTPGLKGHNDDQVRVVHNYRTFFKKKIFSAHVDVNILYVLRGRKGLGLN